MLAQMYASYTVLYNNVHDVMACTPSVTIREKEVNLQRDVFCE